jgi:hypothetical protein
MSQVNSRTTLTEFSYSCAAPCCGVVVRYFLVPIDKQIQPPDDRNALTMCIGTVSVCRKVVLYHEHSIGRTRLGEPQSPYLEVSLD